MFRFFLPILLSILFIGLFACRSNRSIIYNKCYNEYCKNAERELQNSHYVTASQLYHLAFNESTSFKKKDALRMGVVSYFLGSKKLALDYIFSAIQNGLTYEEMTLMLDFYKLKDVSFLSTISHMFDKNRNLFLKKINIVLQDSIRHFLERDSLCRKNDKGNMVYIDSLNIYALKKVIQAQNGLPKATKLLPDDQTRLYALVLHALYYEIEIIFYKKLLDELLLKGYIRPKLYNYALGRSNVMFIIRTKYNMLPDSLKISIADSLMQNVLLGKDDYALYLDKYIECKNKNVDDFSFK